MGGLVINDDTKQVTVDDEMVKLTPIEYNILCLLVKNQGRVFSIEQIYEQIYEQEAKQAKQISKEIAKRFTETQESFTDVKDE